MTGQPTGKNESQNEHDRSQAGAKAWDERTAALAARLEALLEQHRGQPPGGGDDPVDVPAGGPARPRR